jgi:hypothetical protein
MRVKCPAEPVFVREEGRVGDISEVLKQARFEIGEGVDLFERDAIGGQYEDFVSESTTVAPSGPRT